MSLYWLAHESSSNGELHHGRRKVGRQRKRYCNKASLIVYLKDFNINTSTWENAASDSSTWRSMIHKGATHAEALRINADKDKCRTRKARALTDGDMPPTHFFHQSCGRDFCTHIGLINHMLSYRTSLNTLLLWSYSIRNDEQQQHTQKSNSTSYYSYPTDPTWADKPLSVHCSTGLGYTLVSQDQVTDLVKCDLGGIRTHALRKKSLGGKGEVRCSNVVQYATD